MRFLRFATVGVGNTLVTIAAFNAIVALGVAAAPANAVGYVAGFFNSFFWNRYWTFGDRRDLATARVLPRFVVANLGGLAITTAVVFALEALGPLSSATALPPTLRLNAIEACGIGVGLVWNYLLMKVWVFAAEPAR